MLADFWQDVLCLRNDDFECLSFGSSGRFDSQLTLCLTMAKAIGQMNQKPDVQKQSHLTNEIGLAISALHDRGGHFAKFLGCRGQGTAFVSHNSKFAADCGFRNWDDRNVEVAP